MGRAVVRLLGLLIVAVLILHSPFSILNSSAAAAESAVAEVLTFPSLNRTYHMDGSDIEPVRQGPVTVHLSSPANTLVVKAHRLELEPMGDGSYRTRAVVDFLGKGDLVARFETGQGGAGSPMRDELVVPRQTLDVEGRVRFHRVPDGWEVTALELPEEAQVDIRSRLANSLVTTCEQLAAFLGLDCTGLDRGLSRVDVPLPPPGTVFLLEEADLTAEEIRRLDGYLGLVD